MVIHKNTNLLPLLCSELIIQAAYHLHCSPSTTSTADEEMEDLPGRIALPPVQSAGLGNWVFF
jgi:hypothetical protein